MASVLLVLCGIPSRGFAQIAVIDDVILMTNRQKQQEQERRHRHLDPPGGEFLLEPSPGADSPRLGEELFFPLAVPRFLIRHGKRRRQEPKSTRLRSETAANPHDETPLSGPLELLPEDEGPANALSRAAAIERLLAVNSDLAARYQDIPKARADVLTAGLRSNPFLFFSVSNVPYGHFSPQRPGSTTYDLTVIQPFEINGKRGCRIRAAQEAQNVLEAQYQDAVRREINQLDAAFLDVLEARQAVQALTAGLRRLNELEETSRRLVEKGQQPPAESTALVIERANAEAVLLRAKATLLQERRGLALLLGIPAEQAESLEVCGSLHDRAPDPPAQGELIQLALQLRPDLAAHRLGMHRAQADLRREQAEAVDSVFLFYTPFVANDFSPLGKQSATGWGMGVLFSVPLFDRNQGEIARARANVTQTQFEQQGVERRVINEVQYAATENALSREVVREYENEMLADARVLRDEQMRLFANGKATLDSVLEAQKEYDEVVREYLEALVYHRRAMLRLNGAVGQCILP